MNTFVALLRGINVSGHRKIKMADLKESLASLEFTNVQTYLQSGNVIFQSAKSDKGLLEKMISELIQKDFGHEVKVLVDDKAHFIEKFLKNPFGSGMFSETKMMYFIHLYAPIDDFQYQELLEIKDYPEELILMDDMIYAYYVNGFGRSKLSLSFFERKLKVDATARNYNTMNHLVDMLINLD
jgi:uncharacterized protein (DUF1697 family)